MLLQDFKYGFRAIWQSRGISGLAIVCLALGVGLNATMFSVVDGVLIQSLPYKDPDRIVVLSSSNAKANVEDARLSFPDFRDIRDNVRGYETVGLMQYRSLTIADGAKEPERYSGAAVSWNMFEMLGVQPIAGRAFRASDDVPNAEPVVMLSHTVWTLRYQNDPSILNKRVLIDTRPHTVIGVMPPNFEFPELQKMWIPLSLVVNEDRGARGMQGFARLRQGVTKEQADSELAALSSQLASAYPASNEHWKLYSITLRQESIPEEVSLVIWLMMGGATLVLIIACSNVANLLLARATVRRREIAIRASLGAGKWRIVRQLLAESAIMGAMAVPLGLVVANIGTALLRAGIQADDIPYYIQWRVDWRTTVFTIAVALVTAVVFGLMPALHASAGSLHSSLKEGGRGNSGRRSWLRNVLVAAEVAMAVIALVGAMLFVRTFLNLNNASIGFDPAPLMTMRVYMPGQAYQPPDAKTRRVRDILSRVEQLPGVESAYASNFVPLNGSVSGRLTVDGVAIDEDKRPTANFAGVSPNFVKALGLRLVQGRTFTETEGWTRTPYALINETMAREIFANDNPIGRRFQIAQIPGTWLTVIGIVNDVLHTAPDDEDPSDPSVYVPYPYQESLNTGLVVRTAGNPASITPSVREAIRASDANLPVAQTRTMEEVRQRGFWEFRLFGSVFSTIGFLGLALASVGVYGVLSYSVSQRRQEIGVMMALGAGRRDVLRMVMGQGLRLAFAGVLAGLVGAYFTTGLMQSLLFKVSAFDPISFIGVSLFLMVIAAIASAMPARRAMNVDPIIALRQD